MKLFFFILLTAPTLQAFASFEFFQPKETKAILGQKIFEDKRLSTPEGQSCMSCHDPKAAFSDPRHQYPTSHGADFKNFGNRNAPGIMYMNFSRSLHAENENGFTSFEGGFFWDGRANSLEEQAKGPFLNPIEMGATKISVVQKVCESTDYSHIFKKIYGKKVCSINFKNQKLEETKKIENAFNFIADAIAQYEKTSIFSPFSSKFDKVMAKKAEFTSTEMNGFYIFKNPNKGNCASCHQLNENDLGKSLFTDFTYDNLGIPKNYEAFNENHPSTDLGLMLTTQRKEDAGKFKVPTLRNITLSDPYMHNGYFKTLYEVISFYNSRDTKAPCSTSKINSKTAQALNCWPLAEIPQTQNSTELGNLHLTENEIHDLIEFLKTLEDGYKIN